MRRKLFLALLFMLFAKGEALLAQTLVLWMKDGTTVCYDLDDMPIIVFNSEDFESDLKPDEMLIYIATTETEIIYPFSQILYYTYESDPVKVNAARAEGVSISQDADAITVTGLAPDKPVAVYTTEGKMMVGLKSGKDSPTVIPIGNLPTGIYVVKIDGITFKTLKR